jgi:hypothetical protein
MRRHRHWGNIGERCAGQTPYAHPSRAICTISRLVVPRTMSRRPSQRTLRPLNSPGDDIEFDRTDFCAPRPGMMKVRPIIATANLTVRGILNRCANCGAGTTGLRDRDDHTDYQSTGGHHTFSQRFTPEASGVLDRPRYRPAPSQAGPGTQTRRWWFSDFVMHCCVCT